MNANDDAVRYTRISFTPLRPRAFVLYSVLKASFLNFQQLFCYYSVSLRVILLRISATIPTPPLPHRGRKKVVGRGEDGQSERHGESREDINLPRAKVLTHAFLSDVSVAGRTPCPDSQLRSSLCLVFRARVRIYLDSRQGPASPFSVDDSQPGTSDERRAERTREEGGGAREENQDSEKRLSSAERRASKTRLDALANTLLRFKSVCSNRVLSLSLSLSLPLFFFLFVLTIDSLEIS